MATVLLMSAAKRVLHPVRKFSTSFHYFLFSQKLQACSQSCSMNSLANKGTHVFSARKCVFGLSGTCSLDGLIGNFQFVFLLLFKFCIPSGVRITIALISMRQPKSGTCSQMASSCKCAIGSLKQSYVYSQMNLTVSFVMWLLEVFLNSSSYQLKNWFQL